MVVSATTSSSAAITCPDETPGAGFARSLAAGNTLKRSTSSGPVVGTAFTRTLSGIMSPACERTKTLRMSSGRAR